MTQKGFVKYFFMILLPITLVVGVEACKKDTDTFIPTGTTVVSVKKDTAVFSDFSAQAPRDSSTTHVLDIENMIDAVRSPVLKDSITEASDGGYVSVLSELGGISCLAKSFVQKPNGAPCKGKLTIETLLLTTKTDLILNDMPTVSDGIPLISGGVVRVRVLQNGEPVYLAKPENRIIVHFRGKYDGVAPMTYFEGAYATRTVFNWKPFLQPPQDQQTIAVSGKGDTAIYKMLLDRFTFVNCDRFYTDPNLVKSFAVKLPSEYSNQNSAVFIAYKDMLMVLKLQGDPVQRAFTIPKNSKGLPDKAATVVTLSMVKGKYFLGTQSLNNLSAQSAVSVTPSEVTLDDIKLKLKNI
jgi:hypothetical protein